MKETALATTQNGSAMEEIERAQKEGCNLLLPSQQIVGLSEFHAPIVERVQLSINPDDGDVYAHDNVDLSNKDGSPNLRKKWRPTKQALMKLSVCAGVIWSVTESRRIDNGADRNYCAYRAVGGLRKADGQPVFFSADYDMDLEVVEEELREQYERKAEVAKAKGWKSVDIEACVRRDLLQKRKNKLKLCEAGAMNRVLRSLLGIKQAYTTVELQKPFVMVRIVFRPDFSDKEVRQRLIDAHIRAMTGVYGTEAIAQAPKPEAEPIDVTPVADEEPPPEPEPTTETQPDPDENLFLDFENMDDADQGATLERLAKRKGWDLAGFLERSKKATARDLSEAKRIELFAFLSKKEVAAQ